MSQTTGPVPQHVLHGALGTLMIGNWINMMLFSFEVMQVYRYFAANPLWNSQSAIHARTRELRRRLDPAWIRILVLWMFALDVFATGVSCAMVYMYTVTGWGDITRLLTNNGMMVFFGIATALGTLSMHLFLIARYYSFSQATVICSILSLFALTACGLYVFISISLVTWFRHLDDRPKMEAIIIAWAVDTTSTDWLIAGTLMWLFYRIRADFNESQRSTRMLTRLMRISGLSGVGPAFLALLTFIGYMISKDTNLGFMFTISIGRAATLSVLYNLNSRGELADSSHNVSSGATTIYLNTTLDPGHMFGGEAKSAPIVSSGKASTHDGSRRADDAKAVSTDCSSKSKPGLDISAVYCIYRGFHVLNIHCSRQ